MRIRKGGVEGLGLNIGLNALDGLRVICITIEKGLVGLRLCRPSVFVTEGLVASFTFLEVSDSTLC